MTGYNPALMDLARNRVWKDLGGPAMEKVAVVPAAPAGAPMDPAMAAAGGAPPMDPAMAAAGGAPPMDPAMAGMMPGGAPPVDPALAGGAMDPAMAAGAAPPADPAAAAAGGAGAAPPKMKPEQMMQMLDFRLYNLQQQLTAIMNAQGIQLDPGALITPPGSPTPVAEAAVPGGPQDPGAAMSPGGPADDGGGPIQDINPMQPGLAGGGGGEKAAALTIQDVLANHDPATGAAAVAALFRQRTHA